MAALSVRILPPLEEEKDETLHLKYLPHVVINPEKPLGQSAMVVTSIKSELNRMLDKTKDNVSIAFKSLQTGDKKLIAQVVKNEEYVNYLNKEISKFISQFMVQERNSSDSWYLTALFKVCGNLERISDHALNISEYATAFANMSEKLPKEVVVEIQNMNELAEKALDSLYTVWDSTDKNIDIVKEYEQAIDDMTVEYRQNQIQRMENGRLYDEVTVIYSELLTDFERIGDHILNIGQEVVLEKVEK